MENIFVEFLPPWVETGCQPAFYDKESGTVLQQTARMYARVNMLIRMFNKLSKNTKEEVESFERSVTETVDEYIEKFNELHDYVHDYFDNLDVQEEINNKLDAMVEAGTLQEIITTYIQSNVAWTFDNVAEMQTATNLVNGSYAQTYGYYNIGDGGKALYLITDTQPATHYEVLQGGLYAQLVTNGVVHTKQFGIVGDGVTDETTKLQAFFASDNHKYIVDNGTILIDGDINIPSYSLIEFEPDAVVLRKTNSLNTYFMFNMVNKSNITIRNAHLVGDRDTHTGGTGEWGYGMNIAYCNNINIENATIEKTWGDGIYIGASFVDEKTNNIENITCRECRIINCSRNGIAVCAGKNIQIIDCYASGIDRTNPKAGIDIELEFPEDSSETLENIYVKGFSSESCGIGVQTHITSGVAKNIVIDGHTSYNDTYGYIAGHFGYNSNVIYKNANISKITTAGIFISTVDTSKSTSLLIQNIVIDGATSTGKRAIWINGNDTYTTGNITFDNINILNSQGLSDFEFAFNIYWVEGTTRNFSNIIVKNITDNVSGSLHRYSFKGNSYQSVKFENCAITRDISGSVYIGDYSNNFITTTVGTSSTLVLMTSFPDGVYSYSFIGNTDGIDHIVHFQQVKVYDGDTQKANGTGNYYVHITSNCCELNFRKVGDTINIINKIGVTLP